MGERVLPVRISHWFMKHGTITNIFVEMSDSSIVQFARNVALPAPEFPNHYIGKHEKRAGGKRHE